MADVWLNIPARRAYAELLRHFASGRVTNFEFEEQGEQIERTFGADAAVNVIDAAAWYLYDDLKEHRLGEGGRDVSETRREIGRWILFLRSDLPAPETHRWSEGPVRTALAMGGLLCWLVGCVLMLCGPWSWTLIAFTGCAACYAGIWLFQLVTRLSLELRPARRAALEMAERNSIWPFAIEGQLRLAKSQSGYLGAGVSGPRL